MHCNYTVATNNTNLTTHPLYNHATPPTLASNTPQSVKIWPKNASGAKTVNARVFNPEFGSAGPLQGSAKNHILITANIIFSLSSSSFYSGPHDLKSKSKASIFGTAVKDVHFETTMHGFPFIKFVKIPKSHKLWLFCCSEIYYWYKTGWVDRE